MIYSVQSIQMISLYSFFFIFYKNKWNLQQYNDHLIIIVKKYPIYTACLHIPKYVVYIQAFKYATVFQVEFN